ncbi:ATP-grasp domain-containing protein [Aporhodopirellula aestuarii]|uniref:RimK family alpha-L-glutamate ligase n=1 Tax=Aporhodopirellula aestuarii TaxID=2950107 RepID=A0ABT0U9N9_9BACT|nr:RimK family alpha-L-glutamate ligase [Aporhodopirellula aestuarii]MCM2373532.1 RimK family alpha-L-glutamate ligase [Aporhodopirellula aestuarii]
MSSPRILVLGGRSFHRAPLLPLGWHLAELQMVAARVGVELFFADYETLAAEVDGVCTRTRAMCQTVDVDRPLAMWLDEFDGIFTRTMPFGSMEQLAFRLATLHDEYYRRLKQGQQASIVNPPASLELAIDKYATLARVTRMGILTPATIVTQSRSEAMLAFEKCGGDVVVKPIFGGEGRGVMRIRDEELAWTTFSTLSQLGSVFYVQQFCPPGGRDVRLLVIGPHVHAIRRSCGDDFRTNVRAGGRSERIECTAEWRHLAEQICREFDLTFAAVDLIELANGNEYRLVEVNAIPGWKSAQTVMDVNLAEQIISVLKSRSE